MIVAVADSQCGGGGVTYVSVAVAVVEVEVLAAVPLIDFARSWNALKDFGLGSAGALTANTIPSNQGLKKATRRQVEHEPCPQ